jgi:secondary thiamine-phosphate synthase enzyme
MITDTIRIDTTQKYELINITSKIEEIIRNNDVNEGLINISTKHTTSSIIINEDEKGLKDDIINVLKQVIPDNNYLHDRIDNNAKSHLMAMLTTPTQTLPIINGKLSSCRLLTLIISVNISTLLSFLQGGIISTASYIKKSCLS